MRTAINEENYEIFDGKNKMKERIIEIDKAIVERMKNKRDVRKYASSENSDKEREEKLMKEWSRIVWKKKMKQRRMEINEENDERIKE